MTALAAPLPSASTRVTSAVLPVAALLAVAVAMQALWIPVDADVSWLLTLSERVLGGERLYVDLLEANPPASVWLYLPQVWLAERLGLRPELLVVAAAMLGALLSIRCTAALAARLADPPRPEWLAAGCAFVLLVLPGGLFAQREHYALMLALPALTALALVAEGHRLTLPTQASAGIVAGLVTVIKPPLALAFFLPAAWALYQTRQWQPLLIPALTAASTLALYFAAVLQFAPEYADVLPMLQATYLPMRDRPLNLLIGPMLVLPVSLLLLGRLLRVPGPVPLPTCLFLGAAGFALAGLIQGKNYLNHAYPGIALSLLALWLLLALRPREPAMRCLATAGLVLLGGIHLHATTAVQPPPRLVDAIRATGIIRPKLITLGTELATGHPSTRLAEGRWIGSRPSLFTAAAARYVGLDKPQVRSWYRQDLASFVRDVRSKEPDLVLVEDHSRSWLLAEPKIRLAMQRYAPVARAGKIEVWRRR